MKPIKIMHVVRSLATGGMENGVRKLLAGLDPDIFDQKVCTLVKCPNVPTNSFCLEVATDKCEFTVPGLIRRFAQERPDIVHSRNWATIEAITAARLSGVPVVVHSEHGRDLQTMARQLLRRKVLRRISYGWADRVFCVSQELKEYYCRELRWGMTKFEVLPNGVDVERFRPDEEVRARMRAKLGAEASTLVVGTVGRLDPVKDHTTLLRATEMMLERGLDVRVVIAGEGPERKALEDNLAQRPILAQRTVLTGDVQDVAHWLNAFDIFVLPSLSEGMSNTLLEAMATGVPPLATAVGGNAEVIEDGNSGVLVPPGDAKKICEYLLQLAPSPERRRQLGQNARQRIVSHFSLDRMLSRYTEMYCQLMNANQRSVPEISCA